MSRSVALSFAAAAAVAVTLVLAFHADDALELPLRDAALRLAPEQAVAVRDPMKPRPRPGIPCGRCNGNRRAVVFDNGLLLCGECFLRQSMRRIAETKTGGAGSDVRASRWRRHD